MRSIKTLLYEALLIWSAVTLTIELHLPDAWSLVVQYLSHASMQQATAVEYINRMWLP